MDGIVKWFSKDKGYGFIVVDGARDYFFHVSQVRGIESPRQGDAVRFEPIVGKDGKPAASAVEITFRNVQSSDAAGASPKVPYERPKAPYYGQPTFKYKTVPGNFKIGILFACGIVGYFVYDFLGVLVGLVIGTILGMVFGEDKYVPEYEITSRCLKCGGTGQVTSTADGLTGFQCPNCRSFWRKRSAH